MQDLLQVGAIIKTHGIKGEVKVFPLTDDVKRFKKLKEVILEPEKDNMILEIESVKFQKNLVILKFKGFDSINDIEMHVKKGIFVTRKDAVPLEEDEYFVADLIGLNVVTEDDEAFGVVKDVRFKNKTFAGKLVMKDTSEEDRLTQELSKANGAISKVNATHTDELNKINQAYNDKINALKLEAIKLRGDANKAQARLSSYLTAQATAKETLIRLTTEENNFDKYYSGLIKNINDLNQTINQLNNLIRLTNDSYVEIQSHLNIIKKMDNLVKRDFRGYLLTNIINYIDNKAKDYSEIVFGTRDLNVYLDGNALDISYCNKLIDNLSGGEKQRVDLILQFALRDLLNAYFNLGANILVLDEITDFLDSKSCAAVMQLIEKELNSTESVFIVSHHAEELELPIDSEIKIVKNENGISEVL